MSRKSAHKRNTWRQHIEQWKSSGQTQASYCREHSLKGHQFSYWRSKLGVKPESTKHPAPCKPTHNFVPVIVETTQSPSLTICLPNGIRMEGVNTYTIHVAQQLVEVLK